MMAYIVSILIWLLWNGSMSYKCFSSSLQVPSAIGYFIWKRLEYFATKHNGSFMNIIDTISSKIKQKECIPLDKKEFVSICSHGYVISFEQDMIDIQHQAIQHKSIQNRYDL